MIVTKTYCDRCKVEIQDCDKRMFIRQLKPESPLLIRFWPTSYGGKDEHVLCRECIDKFKLFMRNKDSCPVKKEEPSND